MNQSKTSVSNCRQSPRRTPKRGIRATGCVGPLATGPNVVLSLLDISKSGARLLVGVPLEEGQEVEVTLQGPGQTPPIKIPAVVVWSAAVEGGSCVGVFFWQWLSHIELRELAEA
jgi:hypothetical protein